MNEKSIEGKTERPGGYCIRCGHIVQSFEGMTQCPACETTVAPCAWSKEVTVTMNIDELRTMCMWSLAWAEKISTPKADYAMGVQRMVDKLRDQTQHPMCIEHELDELDRVRGIKGGVYKGGARP